jgi:hypothetical protein
MLPYAMQSRRGLLHPVFVCCLTAATSFQGAQQVRLLQQKHAAHLEHAPRSSFRHGQGIDNRHCSIGGGSQQCTLAAIVIIVIVVIIVVVIIMIVIIIIIIVVVIIVLCRVMVVVAAAGTSFAGTACQKQGLCGTLCKRTLPYAVQRRH